MSTCTNYKYDNISGTTLLQPHLTKWDFEWKARKVYGYQYAKRIINITGLLRISDSETHNTNELITGAFHYSPHT